jgi:hypothetical protein
MAMLKNWLITAALVIAFAASSVNLDTVTTAGLASFFALAGLLVIPLGICAFVWKSATRNWLKHSALLALALLILVNAIAFGTVGYAAAIIGVLEISIASILLGLHLWTARLNA